MGGKSSTKCDNSRDRKTTVFIVIMIKLIGQIKKYITVTLAVEKVSKTDNVVHEPLLNIARISLFYTTQNAKIC